MMKLLFCRFNMDNNRVEARFADGTTLAIDCIAVEDEYGSTPAQRAELNCAAVTQNPSAPPNPPRGVFAALRRPHEGRRAGARQKHPQKKKRRKPPAACAGNINIEMTRQLPVRIGYGVPG